MTEIFLKEPPMVWGYMMYGCDKCGEEWPMFLEIGVEDQGKHGRPHQPCPFCISHSCGNYARDMTGRVTAFDAPKPLPAGQCYFQYDRKMKKDSCGNPRIFKGAHHD